MSRVMSNFSFPHHCTVCSSSEAGIVSVTSSCHQAPPEGRPEISRRRQTQQRFVRLPVLLFHTPAIVKLLWMVGLSFLPLTFFKEMLNR